MNLFKWTQKKRQYLRRNWTLWDLRVNEQEIKKWHFRKQYNIRSAKITWMIILKWQSTRISKRILKHSLCRKYLMFLKRKNQDKKRRTFNNMTLNKKKEIVSRSILWLLGEVKVVEMISLRSMMDTTLKMRKLMTLIGYNNKKTNLIARSLKFQNHQTV